MMQEIPAGPYHLEGISLETWLLRFDKDGSCQSPDTRTALLQRLKDKPRAPLILFSHGWNNEFGDATSLYSRFLMQFEAFRKTYLVASEEPIFVGILWPSTVLSSDPGPAFAGTDAAPTPESAYRRELVEGLGDLSSRDRFHALLEAPRLAAAEATELAGLVSDALRDTHSGTGSEGLEHAVPDAEAVLAGMNALQELSPPPPGATDEDDLPEGGTIGGGSGLPLESAGLLGYLDPRWALRLASVYQMKDRAGTVGTNGVAPLVVDMLSISGAPLHAVGHSYGAKVVLSAVAAGILPRQVSTMLLLEPAISHLCFASVVPGRSGPGGYHGVPAKVERSILTTYSKYDFPLHAVFHRALRRLADLGELKVAAGEATTAGSPPDRYAALGGYGPRGSDERLIEPLPEPGKAVDRVLDASLIGFDGSAGDKIKSHGDVATAETAWLLACQMGA